MTTAQLHNLAIFIGAVVANIVAVSVAAALAGDTMPGFREGEFLRPGRDEAIGLLALLVPILSGLVVQNRPRFGSERLAAEVDERRKQGYSRNDLTVVPKDRVAPDIQGIADLDAWSPVVHTACGRVAFLTIAPNTPGETIESDEAIHTDGRPYNVTDDPRCDTCRALLGGAFVRDGVWVAVSAALADGTG